MSGYATVSGRGIASAMAECRKGGKHTKCPSDYLGWQEWAEKKARTHHQVRCAECGLFAVWVKGAAATEGDKP